MTSYLDVLTIMLRVNVRSALCALLAILIGSVAQSLRARNNMTIQPSEVFASERDILMAQAARDGDCAEVYRLVHAGADVNQLGKDGITSLWFALGSGGVDVFESMLKLGANPNITGNQTSVMKMAVIHPNPEFLRLALKYGGDPNWVSPGTGECLIMTAVHTHKDRVRILLDAGFSVNRKFSGLTAVCSTAMISQYDVVTELLERGADPAIPNSLGFDVADIVKNQLTYSAMKRGPDVERVILLLMNRFGIDVEHRAAKR